MNKYEKLFEEIMDKTESGEIKWKQINKSAHSDLIFNAQFAFRQYSGKLEKNDESFEVIFVEKKTEDPAHDFAYDKYIPEILIVDQNNELLITLTDSVIERDQMLELVGRIEEKNDKIKKLFE